MDVQLSTRTMLELTDLLTTVARGAGDTHRHELVFTRARVATRMPPVEVLVLAGVLQEATDRLAAMLSAPPAGRPLAIAS